MFSGKYVQKSCIVALCIKIINVIYHRCPPKIEKRILAYLFFIFLIDIDCKHVNVVRHSELVRLIPTYNETQMTKTCPSDWGCAQERTLLPVIGVGLVILRVCISTRYLQRRHWCRTTFFIHARIAPRVW